METNKYYTPTIEEFHVGFRFEVLNNGVWDWQNMNASRLQEINFDDNLNNTSKYRVKYLDKSDIESVIHMNAGKDFTTNFKLRESSDDELIFQTYWIEENEFLDEEYIYWDIKYNIIKITHKSHTLFVGTIKNKSELIKLLKMLNINA